MRLVIEIPDADKKLIDEFLCSSDSMEKRYAYRCVIEAYKNGTPLPKGHGDLIDRNVLLEEKRMRMYYHLKNGDTAIPIIDIHHAKAVIPAGKGDAECK